MEIGSAASKSASNWAISSVAAVVDPAKGKPSETSSSSRSAIGGDAVTDMMQRLNLTSKEADPLVLDDEGDDDLPCP